MNFQSMETQRKIILIASAVGVISVFLPWVTVSILGMNESVNGFRGIGIIVFLSFIAGVIVALMGNQTLKLEKTYWIIALAAGGAAFLFTIISFADSNTGGMGFVEAGHGFGIWLALISSIAVLAAAWFLKNPADTLTGSFESMKSQISGSMSSSSENRLSELEKLIEMKNQGKITEEEYQQLKSKII